MIPHHWNRAAADNGSADPNADVRPSRPANTILGAIRGLMATGAAARDDAIGELVATLGSNNIYSVNTNEGLIDLATGINGIPAAITKPFLLRLSFNKALTGTATNIPHLVVDGFDCGPMQRRDGSALADGDLPVGAPVLVLGEMAATTDMKVTRVRLLDLTASDIALLAPPGPAATACRLTFASSVQLLLSRSGGSRLLINGVPQTIPAAGVSLGSTGIAGSAGLFVYAFMSGATMTLEAVATQPDIDPNTGIPIKQGDATRTLVGFTVTTASGTFQGGCQTLSFYNRRDLASSTGSFSPGTNSGQWTILQGSAMYGVCWPDEVVDVEFTGSGGITAQNAGVYANLRTVIGDAGLTTPQIFGPQTRAGGNNFVIGGLASRIVTSMGPIAPFAVWAQGFGDAGQSVGYTIAGTLKTRG